MRDCRIIGVDDGVDLRADFACLLRLCGGMAARRFFCGGGGLALRGSVGALGACAAAGLGDGAVGVYAADRRCRLAANAPSAVASAFAGAVGAVGFDALFFFADKPPPSASALAHILPSALASAFAASAMLQWMDLRLAENARRRLADTSAPPILTMEENCFRALRLSFWLLSLALLSGIGGMLAGGDAPAHKIIFAALAWLAFGGLLAGRRFRGWRGPAARWWLAAGLLFFILSYFGTHFVLQVLLGRVN